MPCRLLPRALRVGVPIFLCAVSGARAQEPTPRPAQFPSPMVEHTRAHPRLDEERPPGRREQLTVGSLFIPAALADRETLPLLIHFHGGAWLPEVAAARRARCAVVSLQLGSGSTTYAKPFREPDRFGRLLDEVRQKTGRSFDRLVLSGWSAGYGAIREILRSPDDYARVDAVLLIDGLHAGYKRGTPGPKESELLEEDLAIFVQFARDAAAGRKQLIITHSEIFPGTFASTTETTEHLLRQLDLRRTPVLKWGPMGTQQLSEAGQGKLSVIGYAGNSAPDHVDQLHSLVEYLEWIEWEGAGR